MNPEFMTAINEIKSGISRFDERIDRMQTQLDALDLKGQHFRTGGPENKLRSILQESNELKAMREGRSKSAMINLGALAMELKTTVSTSAVGRETSGVLRHDRIVDGAVPTAQRRTFMRDVLPQFPTQNTAVDFVRENVFTNNASMQVEASDKAESALTFNTATAIVRTIAHWIPATRQVLDDFKELEAVITRKLFYGYLVKEDSQILFGSGAGNDLNGLVTQATAFSTSLLGSGVWHKADVLRRAHQQVQRSDEAGIGFFVVHPDDWSDIELAKDAQRQYIAGDPRSMLAPTLWGLPVVVTTAMTSGSFLAASSEAADLRIREQLNVEISTEHSDYFVKNMVAIRAEGRVALPVYRPAALIYGSFTTSPAS